MEVFIEISNVIPTVYLALFALFWACVTIWFTVEFVFERIRIIPVVFHEEMLKEANAEQEDPMVTAPKTVPFHIPPIYIFVGVILSCLITGFIVDCIMQRYGCCGEKGGCCKESPTETGDGGEEVEEGLRLTQREGSANNPIEPV